MIGSLFFILKWQSSPKRLQRVREFGLQLTRLLLKTRVNPRRRRKKAPEGNRKNNKIIQFEIVLYFSDVFKQMCSPLGSAGVLLSSTV